MVLRLLYFSFIWIEYELIWCKLLSLISLSTTTTTTTFNDDLRLSQNLLYGKLDFMDFMCETRKKGGYFAFSANCVGTPAEIICSCCDICWDKFDVSYYMDL